MSAKKIVKAAKKSAAKKAPAKKPAAKKPIAKKASAKKAPVKKTTTKKAGVKKAAAPKKVAAQKPVAKKPVKPAKVTRAEKAKAAEQAASAAQKSIDFAKQIAAEMKRSAAEADRKNAEAEIRLTRRPTTRQQGKESVKFPASDLKEFRKRLLDARAKAASGVNAMRETGFNESEDHEADGGDGTNQTLRLMALGQMGNINRTIQQIEEALHRIDDGTYGICTMCGQLIRKQRLMNQPFVLTCMECQSEMERRGR